MLRDGVTTLRLDAQSEAFAAVTPAGATDAIAFASHLAPDVTVGFFDDVMSLFVTERPGGFSPAEIDMLHLVTPVFALSLGARLNAVAARVLLQTYLGSDAANALLTGRVSLGAVEQIRSVVVYCDLFGFTSLTEMLDAKSLVEHLNLFFDTVTRPAARAGGQVSGHVGDAVVMFFPVNNLRSERSICAAAVKAALEGLEALEALNAMNPRRLTAPLRARVGIDIGDVVHGNIGSAGRFSFTIIGTPVNRAARLQALAKDLGAAVLMTSRLAEAAGIQGRPFGKHALRGFGHPVELVGFAISERQTQVAGDMAKR
jgi:class 3 adenylate cyclase